MRRVLTVLMLCGSALRAMASLPYLDASLPVDARVADLLGRMTLQEKVNQMLHLVDIPPNMTGDEFIRQTYGSTGVGTVNAFWLFNSSCNASPTCFVAAQNELQAFLMSTSRLGLPTTFNTETLHSGVPTGTIFPMPCLLGATWNPTLVNQVASVIAQEARAGGVDKGFSPEINVCTDPRFGRTEENFGEDPQLVATMGVAYVTGLQGNTGGPSAYLDDLNHIVSEAKHFAAYAYGGKDGYPAETSLSTLHDVYLWPWRKYAAAGGRGVMASHNSVNRVPMHANAQLLTQELRTNFGMTNGLIASDYRDILLLTEFGLYGQNTTRAAVASVSAGMDQDLGAAAFPTLVAAVQAGLVNQSAIDRAAGNVLRHKFAARLFDTPIFANASTVATVDNPVHRSLARQAAREGAVLLKNDGGILPLRLSNGSRVAVVGPNAACFASSATQTVPSTTTTTTTTTASTHNLRFHAPAEPATDCDATHAMTGGYTQEGAPVVTVAAALANASAASSGQFSVLGPLPGCNIADNDLSLLPAAVALVQQADVAIVVVGDSGDIGWRGSSCGEDEDRTSLDLPGGQLDLISAIADTGVPFIVLLIHGRPATFGAGPSARYGPFNSLLTRIPALLALWRPGEEGGNAAVDLLFSAQGASPSGRLTQAWPPTVGGVHGPTSPWFQLPQGDFQNELYVNEPANTSTPLFPFGFGLGYTTFSLSNVAAPTAPLAPTALFVVNVTVQNTGSQDGTTVVQLYASQNNPSLVRFRYTLLGFQKVFVPAGPNPVVVSVSVSADDLGYFHPELGRHVVDADTYVLVAAQDASGIATGPSVTITIGGTIEV